MSSDVAEGENSSSRLQRSAGLEDHPKTATKHASEAVSTDCGNGVSGSISVGIAAIYRLVDNVETHVFHHLEKWNDLSVHAVSQPKSLLV